MFSFRLRCVLVLGLLTPQSGCGSSTPPSNASGGALWGSGGAALVGGDAGSGVSSGGSGGSSIGGASGSDAPGSGGLVGGDGAGGDEPLGTGGSGEGTPDICTFAIEGTTSPQIPTVGVIDWSTTLDGLTDARIEFSLDEPKEGELNRGGGGPISVSHPEALMLGLKPGRSYTYRIVVSAGETECISPNRSLTTGTLSEPSEVTHTLGEGGGARDNGFVIVSAYPFAGAYVIDADGEIVWRSLEEPSSCSRALMDWDGEFMWMLSANPSAVDAGEVYRVRMDGTDFEAVPGLERSHHDFAVLPGGATAFLVWAKDAFASDLIERSADGTIRTIARLDERVFPANGDYHSNAVRYAKTDDSYTVSDRSTAAIVKLDRAGQVAWRVQPSCEDLPPAECAVASIGGNHGHQITSVGNLLVFSTALAPGAGSPTQEFSFNQVGGALTATLAWSHLGELRSDVLGDAERLSGGNTLITYSTAGVIEEISMSGALVRRIGATWGKFGYAKFRKTLYGPPE